MMCGEEEAGSNLIPDSRFQIPDRNNRDEMTGTDRDSANKP